MSFTLKNKKLNLNLILKYYESKIFLSALLLAVYSISNAQLKVLQAGQVLNQILILGDSNNPSDRIA